MLNIILLKVKVNNYANADDIDNVNGNNDIHFILMLIVN